MVDQMVDQKAVHAPPIQVGILNITFSTLAFASEKMSPLIPKHLRKSLRKGPYPLRKPPYCWRKNQSNDWE
jgi:hypothetical protein